MALRHIGIFAVAAALLAGCAVNDSYESSSGGIALRIDDDLDALNDALARAENHCADHDGFAVLQGVSEVEDDQLVATFNCARTRGEGVALVVRDEDDMDQVTDRAQRFCANHNRVAVLQSVSPIDGRGVAAFECRRT